MLSQWLAAGIVLAGLAISWPGQAQLSTADDRLIDRGVFAQRNQNFGRGLAVGDFNGDGFDDLVAGLPGDFFLAPENGSVRVFYGEEDGLDSFSDEFLQGSGAIAGTQEAGDQFGLLSAAGDFNSDGFDDLALGVPFEDLDGPEDAGIVQVIYGASSRLDRQNNEVWGQDSPGIFGEGESGDQFGSALAACDINDDGHDDLAIGVALEDVGNNADSGGVHVLYGGLAGLTATGSDFLTQGGDILGSTEPGDRFGAALTCADYNNDGFDDLAVGSPAEAVGALAQAGAVNVLYGSPGGVDRDGDQLFIQGTDELEGIAEADDEFGGRLASGDFDGDGFQDLAIGAPGENIGTIADAGAVQVLYGSVSGLSGVGDAIFEQNQTAVEGDAEAGDRFGERFTVGDFDGDGVDDLAIGVPEEAVGSLNAAGAVNVLYGSSQGLNLNVNQKPSQLLFQDVPGSSGSSEAGDRFGRSLVAGYFGGDASTDLAVGIPGQTVNNNQDAGQVQLFFGSDAIFSDGFEQ